MVINLDTMTQEELWAFHTACRDPEADWVKRARELFPDRPVHYIKAAKTLSKYAYYKAASMEHDIDIDNFDDCEFMCKYLYKQLPKWARW